MPVDVDALVVSNTRLGDHYNVVVLEAPAIAAAARPGQFVMVKLAGGTDPLLRRPFSIFEIVGDREGQPVGVALLNKRVGAATALLFDLEPGRRVPCLGPLGRPFEVVSPPVAAWLVAGGVGLAPFVPLAEALAAQGVETTLFYGARRAAELLALDRFERLGTRLVLATEDGTRGHHGLVSEPLARALETRPPEPPLVLYACGPTPMMRAVASLAQRAGRRAWVSLEPMMGCGLGGCYGCVVPIRRGAGAPHFVRACLEGPVFEAGEVVWEAVA
jgi:dihydroorotate dehydrogenase electron transfer subunit